MTEKKPHKGLREYDHKANCHDSPKNETPNEDLHKKISYEQYPSDASQNGESPKADSLKEKPGKGDPSKHVFDEKAQARLRLKELYRKEREDRVSRLQTEAQASASSLIANQSTVKVPNQNTDRMPAKENAPPKKETFAGEVLFEHSDAASKDQSLGLFSRMRDSLLTHLAHARSRFSERAKRSDLSKTPGQSEERTKQRKNLAIVFTLLILLSLTLVYLGTQTQKTKTPEIKIVKSDFRIAPNGLEKQSFQRSYGEKLEKMDAAVKELEATLEQLDRRLKREQEKNKKASRFSNGASSIPNVSADTDVLIAAAPKATKPEKPRMARLTVASPETISKKETQKRTNSAFAPDSTAPIHLREEPLALNRARGQSAYLPAGSFASAVVLSGVTAPTGAAATSNPIPMLLEITDLAQLPNDFRAKIDRCFVTANATGDLSSERVWIRLDRMSCMRQDARAIDVKVRGYVTGEDGKTGVRARVVTRSGQAIANALLLGSISGFGKALSSSASQSTTYSTGSIGTRVENPWKAGAGQTISDASDRLVDYYIKLADKIFPVLELDSGRTVDVVLSQGVTLGDSNLEGTSLNGSQSQGTVNNSRVFGERLRQSRDNTN